MSYKTNELYHYGVLGMKWGIRRYQNYDGSLTSAGKQRYSYESVSTKYHGNMARKLQENAENLKRIGYSDSDRRVQRLSKRARRQKIKEELSRRYDRREEDYARQVTAAGNLAVRALTGNVVGGKGYQMYLAMLDGDHYSDVGKKVVAAMMSVATGGSIGSRHVKEIMLSRQAKDKLQSEYWNGRFKYKGGDS